MGRERQGSGRGQGRPKGTWCETRDRGPVTLRELVGSGGANGKGCGNCEGRARSRPNDKPRRARRGSVISIEPGAS